MKKFYSIMAVILIGLTQNLIAAYIPEQTEEAPVNSLAIAGLLAEKGIVGYDFQKDFERSTDVSVPNTSTYEAIRGKMNLQGLFTSMEHVLTTYTWDDEGGQSRDVVITPILNEGEGTLSTIPYITEGLEVDVGLEIEGITESGQNVGRGWVFYDTLLPGSVMQIKLNFDSVRVNLNLPGGEGYTIVIDGETTGYWSSWYNYYRVYVDMGAPGNTHSYQIFDDAGNMISVGVLNSSYQLTQNETKYTGIQVELEGNVSILSAKSNYSTYAINGTVYEGLNLVPAKIFVIDVSNGCHIDMYGNFEKATLSYFSANETYEIASLSEGGHLTRLDPQDLRLVLVVYGDEGDEFNLYFNTTADGYYVGGKG